MRNKLFLPAMLAVFTASGFAGLIYESIWSHYLKLFLGHAAYAQTLVLAIFMGGMAVGAWATSRISSRLRDPLAVYAGIEVAIGVTSLFFHQVFVAITDLAFDRVIPSLGGPGAVQAFKWSLAALLILPQSVLLGATFPLMTAGVLRLRPARAGYVVAMLYFTNSLGAAAGVLASGFYFIAAAGLPGTLVAAGVINLAVALAVLLLRPRGQADAVPAPAPAAPSPAPARAPRLGLMLAVAALTGASSFMYEIGWIRMLSLVLGSSTHAFELMLSAFILGIAFGGLAIRRRIDAADDAVRLLGWVQLAMGIAALATLPVYGSTFLVMEATLHSLARTEGGYVAFNVVSHAICLAVMFPAAFCAGMTLPLITTALLRARAGERAVGQVYAANTAGAIVGVILAVHVGFELLGLKGLIVAGAAIDVALGVLLLAIVPGARRYVHAAGMAAALALIATMAGVHLDAARMSSGVFRGGNAATMERIVEQRDGKTATVSVTEQRGAVALRTNGKSDGAIRVGPGGPPAVDEVLMVLAGALPQFFAPEARRAAVIGFGTGLTTHSLLASTNLEVVDTVEIEPAILRVAPHFRPFNDRALDDPRSRVYFDDAKTFFSARQQRYDVIVSEPSNPWVSGVSGLFSVEFYSQVRRHLNDGGLLVQWVHVYEMTPALVATIVTALAANFGDYELWMANHGDMLVVAAHKGKVPPIDARAFDNPRMRAQLERFNIRNMDDLLQHRVAGRAALGPYYAAFGVPANSDFAPILDLNATFARFLRQQVDDVPSLMEAGLPLLGMFDRGQARARSDPSRLSIPDGQIAYLRRTELARQARFASTYLRGAGPVELELLPGPLTAQIVLLRGALVRCTLEPVPEAIDRALGDVAQLINSHLSLAERQAVWKLVTGSPCHARLKPETRRWLALHTAAAAENGKLMARAAEALLAEPGDMIPELMPYTVAAHMSGLLLQGESQAALESFQKHRGSLRGGPAWEPVFRFLVGQTAAK